MTDPTLPITAEPRRFEPDTPAAIHPAALGRRWTSWREAARVRAELGADGWPKPYGMVGTVAVVSIDGPLVQRGGWYWDGHDAIAERVRAALAEPKATAVLLKINSPGGIAAGCFEAVRAVRAAAAAAGKPLVAFADEMACSAAFAFACAASRIYLPPSGEVGSVGVLSAVVSMKRALDAEGIDVQVIRSGAKKASGHPYDALSDAAVAREQADVDALAAQFYALVAESRGMAADAVAALEGDVRMGAAAVAAGLADGVMTFDEAVRAAATTPAAAPGPTPKRNTTMSEKFTHAALALCGTTDEDTALGKLAAWKDGAARAATLEKELGEARATQAKASRDAVLTQAVADRKITPAQAAAARAGTGFLASLSTEQLAAYVAEAVPVAAAPAGADPVTPPAKQPAAAAEVTLNDEEKRQAKAMGVSEADMLAAKKAHLAAA